MYCNLEVEIVHITQYNMLCSCLYSLFLFQVFTQYIGSLYNQYMYTHSILQLAFLTQFYYSQITWSCTLQLKTSFVVVEYWL